MIRNEYQNVQLLFLNKLLLPFLGKMVKCRDAGLQFRISRVRDKFRSVVGIGLVLGLVMVLGLAHFTFCHTSSPQARILPIFRLWLETDDILE